MAKDKCRTGIPDDHSKAPAFSSARAGVPTASDHSKPDTAALHRVVNKDAWGESQATQRYGAKTETFPAAKDAHAPQQREDQHDRRMTMTCPKARGCAAAVRAGSRSRVIPRLSALPMATVALTTPRSATARVRFKTKAARNCAKGANHIGVAMGATTDGGV